MGKKTKEQKYKEAVERNIEANKSWLHYNLKSIGILLRSKLGIKPTDTQFDDKIIAVAALYNGNESINLITK